MLQGSASLHATRRASEEGLDPDVQLPGAGAGAEVESKSDGRLYNVLSVIITGVQVWDQHPHGHFNVLNEVHTLGGFLLIFISHFILSKTNIHGQLASNGWPGPSQIS